MFIQQKGEELNEYSKERAQKNFSNMKIPIRIFAVVVVVFLRLSTKTQWEQIEFFMFH